MLHLVVELARDAPQQLADEKTTRISKLHARSLPQTTHPTRALRSEPSVGSQPRAILRSDPRSGGQRTIAHGCKGGQRTAAQAAGSGCRPMLLSVTVCIANAWMDICLSALVLGKSVQSGIS